MAPSGSFHGEATQQRIVRLEVGCPDQPRPVPPPNCIVAILRSDFGCAELHRCRPFGIVESRHAPAIRLRHRREPAWSDARPPATGPARSGMHVAYGAPPTSHHAIGAGPCEAGVGLAVLQSANLWGRPVTLFACTFASGAQAVGTISEFFRKMARPAGFEPATLGLEGQRSTRGGGGHSGLGLGESVINGGHILCTADCPHPPCFLRKKKGSACVRPLRR